MQVEREQTLPKRTADSLRNFWKNVERKGLENYMRNALESNTWFCHAFSKIPKVRLVCTYREDEANGELEKDMITLAENAIQRKTHRQQHMDKSKLATTKATSKDIQGKRATRKGNQNGGQGGIITSQDDDIDLSVSQGLSKRSKALEISFNLLDRP